MIFLTWTSWTSPIFQMNFMARAIFHKDILPSAILHSDIMGTCYTTHYAWASGTSQNDIMIKCSIAHCDKDKFHKSRWHRGQVLYVAFCMAMSCILRWYHGQVIDSHCVTGKCYFLNQHCLMGKCYISHFHHWQVLYLALRSCANAIFPTAS